MSKTVAVGVTVLVALIILSAFIGIIANQTDESNFCKLNSTTTYYNETTGLCQDPANASITSTTDLSTTELTLFGLSVILVIIGLGIVFVRKYYL